MSSNLYTQFPDFLDKRGLRMLYLYGKILQIDVGYNITFQTELRGPLADMVIDPVESRFLLLGAQDGSISVFDTSQPMFADFDKLEYPQIASITSENSQDESTNIRSRRTPVVCLQWYPTDSGVFISAGTNKTVKIWDTNAFECIDTIKLPEVITWLSMSPISVSHNLIGVSLGSTSEELPSRAVLVDPLIGAVAMTLSGGHSQLGLSQVIWSPRSSYTIITGGRDGRILYWDIRFPVKPLYSLDKQGDTNSLYSTEAVAHTGAVLGLIFSPDGMHLISWGGSGVSHDATCLRMWSSGTGESEKLICDGSSHSNTPQLRPVNFGTVFADTTNNRTQQLNVQSLMHSDISARATGISQPHPSIMPIRLATAPCMDGDTWGASSFYVFAPSRNRLLTALASKRISQSRIVTRHFAKIRACVWNNRQLELYTCGMDGNLLSWPIFPPTNNNEDDTTFEGIHDEL